MSIVSRLTFPVLSGGIVLLFAASAFAPPVQATSFHVDTVARTTSELSVRSDPAGEAECLGAIEANTFVWVERCIASRSASDWCLVERAGLKGWVRAHHLALHWE